MLAAGGGKMGILIQFALGLLAILGIVACVWLVLLLSPFVRSWRRLTYLKGLPDEADWYVTRKEAWARAKYVIDNRITPDIRGTKYESQNSKAFWTAYDSLRAIVTSNIKEANEAQRLLDQLDEILADAPAELQKLIKAAKIDSESEPTERPREVMTKVTNFIRDNKRVAPKELFEASLGSNATVYRALKYLTDKGKVESVGRGEFQWIGDD